MERGTGDEESEVDVLRRLLAEAQERERNQLGLTMIDRRCKDAARGLEAEWRDRCAALEEENRCLEEAAAEAAHKSEAWARLRNSSDA